MDLRESFGLLLPNSYDLSGVGLEKIGGSYSNKGVDGASTRIDDFFLKNSFVDEESGGVSVGRCASTREPCFLENFLWCGDSHFCNAKKLGHARGAHTVLAFDDPDDERPVRSDHANVLDEILRRHSCGLCGFGDGSGGFVEDKMFPRDISVVHISLQLVVVIGDHVFLVWVQ